MSSSPKLSCELCRKPIAGAGAVAAIEVVTERDSYGKVVSARDGYNVVFHESCWNDLQARRVYSAGTYRRPRPHR